MDYYENQGHSWYNSGERINILLMLLVYLRSIVWIRLIYAFHQKPKGLNCLNYLYKYIGERDLTKAISCYGE